MSAHRIAVIPGDGVGVDVTDAARQVLEAAAKKWKLELEYVTFDWGSDHYLHHRHMMPSNALETLRGFEAILLGAVGHPDVPDHITLNGLLLPIRRTFDQYANVRPAYLYPGIESPLRGEHAKALDMVIVRENTEGEYAQVGGFVHHHHADEVAVQTGVFTRRGIERVIRFAFELAVKRNRKRKVTSITKSNAQGFAFVLWDRVFKHVANDFPDVDTETLLVDAAAMNFIRRPQSFDVVVASNLFGDILSDISAILAGSIGMAASANINPGRAHPSMFEPVHGSAPDIVGMGIVNPLAAILSASMMLEHLGESEAAKGIDAAIAAVLARGDIRTPDLGGTSRTEHVTEAVIAAL